MQNRITFPNPPITEALLDIRVTLPSDFKIEELEKFYEKVSKDYPTKQKNITIEAAFNFKPGENPEVKQTKTPNGYILKNPQNTKIIQARTDGFTFSKLKPYDSWEKFSKEAGELLSLYLEIVKPKSINRVALRYINLIEIPNLTGDFKEYFLTGPEIASGIPQALAEFFVRMVIPDPSTDNIAIITETVDKKKLNENIFPLIFDIDVFKLANLQPNSEELWKIINSLREYKNQVFFNSFTDKAKELFK